MVSIEAAQRGLERAYTYVREKQNQEVLYTPTVQNIKELKRQAKLIEQACDAVLQAQGCNSEITDSFKQKPVEPVPAVEPEIIPEVKNKPEVKQVEVKRQSVPKPYPPNYAKSFKSVLHKAAKVDKSTSDYPLIVEFAQLVDQCFQIRFNPKHDPYKIHQFSVYEFKNYLLSYVIAFAKSWDAGEVNEFFGEVQSWLENIPSGSVKYTMPSAVNSVYFPMFKNLQGKKTDFELTEENVQTVKQIWKQLWDLGYSEFTDLDPDDGNDYDECIPMATIFGLAPTV